MLEPPSESRRYKGMPNWQIITKGDLMADTEGSTKADLARLQNDNARPTICSDAIELISDVAEVGLDEILQNGFLRDIPIISTAVSIYIIGNNIHSAHLLKKYACFLDEFNRDSFENGSRDKYKQYFEESNRKRDIEYLLILLERFIETDKARRLAKIYEAYLDKGISWDDLRLFAETLDRFLPGDYEMLREKEAFQTLRGRETEVLLRLTGLGLLIEDIHRPQWRVLDEVLTIDDPDDIEREERIYRRTEFGNRMVSILS